MKLYEKSTVDLDVGYLGEIEGGGCKGVSMAKVCVDFFSS